MQQSLIPPPPLIFFFFFFNDTATTEIYPFSLHDPLPIYSGSHGLRRIRPPRAPGDRFSPARGRRNIRGDRGARTRPSGRVGPQRRTVESERLDHRECFRSEEHTSELQSRQ